MTPDARAARERKQKIFVVVGGLFLLAMLAVPAAEAPGGSGASCRRDDARRGDGAARPGRAPDSRRARRLERRRACGPGKLTSFGVFTEEESVRPAGRHRRHAAGDAAAAAGGEKKGEPEGDTARRSSRPARRPRPPAVTIVTVNGVAPDARARHDVPRVRPGVRARLRAARARSPSSSASSAAPTRAGRRRRSSRSASRSPS